MNNWLLLLFYSSMVDSLFCFRHLTQTGVNIMTHLDKQMLIIAGADLGKNWGGIYMAASHSKIGSK